MKTKNQTHTPGPWRLESQAGIGWRSYKIIGNRGGECEIGHVRLDGRPQHEGEANARLIAAAPELLAEAKFALLMIERGMGWQDFPEPGGVSGLRNSLRAAIAKAEGR